MTTDEAVKLWGGQTRLAKALGITRDAIYKWEESKSGITYTFMSTIAECYDCSDWIGRYLESGLAVKLPNACRDTVFYGRD